MAESGAVGTQIAYRTFVQKVDSLLAVLDKLKPVLEADHLLISKEKELIDERDRSTSQANIYHLSSSITALESERSPTKQSVVQFWSDLHLFNKSLPTVITASKSWKRLQSIAPNSARQGMISEAARWQSSHLYKNVAEIQLCLAEVREVVLSQIQNTQRRPSKRKSVSAL